MPSRTFILEYETDEGKDNYESLGQNVCIVRMNANQHDYEFSPEVTRDILNMFRILTGV